MNKNVELLAPAGNMEKLQIALTYGADAVYFSGQNYGLRAFAGNFTNDEIVEAVNKCHSLGKRAYVTLNILARDSDFVEMDKYLSFLCVAGVDAVIISDIGLAVYVLKNFPSLDVHISTQANVTNSKTACFLAGLGVKRIVLARELTLDEIINIRKTLPKSCEIECFVHGAMCISYSGRCLLSNLFTGRDSNRGECVQACRWKYVLKEANSTRDGCDIEEDERGTYILNSKDLCMISYINKLVEAGISSFKIEGRMKSQYYVATVVNAYRKMIDKAANFDAENELRKTSHRDFTTGFYFGDKDNVLLSSSSPMQDYDFIAMALDDFDGEKTLFEMRNKFATGDELEILSPSNLFNKTIKIEKITDEEGDVIDVAKKVQQKIYIYSDYKFRKFDILRRKNS